jgi:hypothetical protein
MTGHTTTGQFGHGGVTVIVSELIGGFNITMSVSQSPLLHTIWHVLTGIAWPLPAIGV